MISYFITMVTGIYYFMQGFMYRPHEGGGSQQAFIGSGCLLVSVFLILKKAQVGSAALWVSIVLILTVVVNHFVHGHYPFLYSTLIILGSSLMGLLCLTYLQSGWMMAVVSWLQIECFTFGLNLSKQVEIISQ